VVSPIAAEGGLPANLPYAIMNAESGLRPWVDSPAGARGLMQLMPALAGALHARRWPARPWNADDLYLPAYNAALGTSELVALHQRFVGRGVEPGLPLVIAGYNGGAEAVERWLAADPRHREGDRLMEDIGYTETRQYVRRVLGFLDTWDRLYGEAG
jgi:soluble lytic murein transglycosylase